METSGELRPVAWCPLTPRGVAAFAGATFGRLWLVQLGVALIAAATVAWVLDSAWVPTISQAIEHLPQQGQISSGRLAWAAESPQLLAESRFLAIAVDLEHGAQTRSAAHVQAEFGKTDVRFYSLFGCLPLAYPPGFSFAFNYEELKPWFGAWSPTMLAISAIGTVVWLILSWMALSTFYCVASWLLALYFNRELPIVGSWRLSGAALMPGALMMVAALAVYGLGQLDLVRLIAAFVLHFVIGWVYLVLGVLACPPIPSLLDEKKNPFGTPAVPAPLQDTAKIESSNPFRRSDG